MSTTELGLVVVPGALSALGLLCLLIAEAKSVLGMRALAKICAATGFVWGGWVVLPSSSAPLAAWVFAGLCLSWVGDICLISEARRMFMLGLVAFLLAHVAYAVGFCGSGASIELMGLCLPGVALVGVAVDRWLAPHLSDAFRWPVRAYIVAIVLMTTAAASRWSLGVMIPLGGVCFMISDLAVARQRFVARSVVNRMWGLPLYFGAQWLFILGLISESGL